MEDFLFSLFFNMLYIGIAVAVATPLVKYIWRKLGERADANDNTAVSKELIRLTYVEINEKTVAKYSYAEFCTRAWELLVNLAQKHPRSSFYANKRGEMDRAFRDMLSRYEKYASMK